MPPESLRHWKISGNDCDQLPGKLLSKLSFASTLGQIEEHHIKRKGTCISHETPE